MSSNQSSSYTSYSSTSYSSSSSTNPQGTTKTHTEHINSNDRDGTTYERTTSETGKPTLVETAQVPPGGGRIQGGNGGNGGDAGGQGRIEDVTDADREYLERMEDEYAKREGGA